MEEDAVGIGARDYDALFRARGIPGVGELVRCRQTGSLWRIMIREVWRWLEEDPLTREPQIVTRFYLAFWRFEEGAPPGVGQMLGQLYSFTEDQFSRQWELTSHPGGRAAWLH